MMKISILKMILILINLSIIVSFNKKDCLSYSYQYKKIIDNDKFDFVQKKNAIVKSFSKLYDNDKLILNSEQKNEFYKIIGLASIHNDVVNYSKPFILSEIKDVQKKKIVSFFLNQKGKLESNDRNLFIYDNDLLEIIDSINIKSDFSIIHLLYIKKGRSKVCE